MSSPSELRALPAGTGGLGPEWRALDLSGRPLDDGAARHLAEELAGGRRTVNAINLRRSPLTLEALLTLCRAPAASSPLVAPLGVVHLRNEKRAFAVQPCAGAPPEDFGETPSYGHLSLEAFEELELLSTSPLAILSFGLVLARRSRPPHDSGWVAARNIVTNDCGERAYDLLASSGDDQGICLFFERVVERLGCDIVQKDRLHAFAKSCVARPSGERRSPWELRSLPLSYQGLLEQLSNRSRKPNKHSHVILNSLE